MGSCDQDKLLKKVKKLNIKVFFFFEKRKKTDVSFLIYEILLKQQIRALEARLQVQTHENRLD